MSAPQYPDMDKSVPVAQPVDAPVATASPPPNYSYAPPAAQPQFQQPSMQQPMQQTLQPYMLTSGPTAGACPSCQQMQTTRVQYEAGKHIYNSYIDGLHTYMHLQYTCITNSCIHTIHTY